MMPKPEGIEEFLERGEQKERKKQIEELQKALEKEAAKNPKGSAVDGPEHYRGYEVLEAICNAGFAEGFCLGNAVKYLLRAQGKGKHHQDLEKAQFYLNWYLDHYEKYVGE